MAISVVEPVGDAFQSIGRVCFRPFQVGKWFVMGFCAFLAGCVEGGVNVPGCQMRGTGAGPSDQDVQEAVRWMETHLALVVAVAAAVLVLMIALGVLFTWLGSRGQFMFLDNVVRNRGAVVEPWYEYRAEGNSVFWFRILFGLATLVAMLAVVGGAVLLAWGDIQAKQFGLGALAALLVGTLGVLTVSLVSGIIGLFLTDFVVPIMFLRRAGVLAAWREFRTELLPGRVGTFVLYVLFRIVLGIAVGVLVGVATCLTCCLAAIPYAGTHVLLLPVHVFNRA